MGSGTVRIQNFQIKTVRLIHLTLILGLNLDRAGNE